MSYTPQPGTIPAKAIEWLRAQPPGAEVSSAELAEAIGADTSSIIPCLVTPRQHGIVKSSHRPGNKRLLYWSLGDGTLMEKPHDYVPDEPLHDTAQKKPQTKLAGEFKALRDAMDAEAAAPAAEPAPKKKAEPKKKIVRDVVFAAYSDGTMLIDVGYSTVRLNADEADQLIDFVLRIGRREGEK